MLPLDVYLENEHELYTKAVSGEIADELKGTVGEKLLSSDLESRVVVNFHGVGYTFVRFFTLSFSMSLFYLCKTHNPFASYILSFSISGHTFRNLRSFNLPTSHSHLSTPYSFDRLMLTHPECRSHSPRASPINLPLHLRHPKNSPAYLRLPRLWSIYPKQ